MKLTDIEITISNKKTGEVLSDGTGQELQEDMWNDTKGWTMDSNELKYHFLDIVEDFFSYVERFPEKYQEDK